MPRKRETLVIRRAEQLRALGTPMRLRVLRTLEAIGPATVAEIAERIDRKPVSLYYHVHALVEAGLVREAGTRPGPRRDEVLYDTVARSIRVDPGRGSPAMLEAFADLGTAALRRADRTHRRALMDPEVRKAGPRRERVLLDMRVQLDGDDLEALNRRLDELVEFLDECDARAEGGAFYDVTLTFGPDYR